MRFIPRNVWGISIKNLRNSLYFSLLAGNLAENSFAGLPPPPHSLECREIRLDSSENRGKLAQFRNYCSKTGPEKVIAEC
jgi:hypothetical protein